MSEAIKRVPDEMLDAAKHAIHELAWSALDYVEAHRESHEHCETFDALFAAVRRWERADDELYTRLEFERIALEEDEMSEKEEK